MTPIVTINSLHQLKQTLGVIAGNSNYTNIAINIDEMDLETMKTTTSSTSSTLKWLQDAEVAKLWGEVKEKVVVLVEGREFSNQEIKQFKALGVVGSFVCEDVLKAKDLKVEFQARKNKITEAMKTS